MCAEAEAIEAQSFHYVGAGNVFSHLVSPHCVRAVAAGLAGGRSGLSRRLSSARADDGSDPRGLRSGRRRLRRRRRAGCFRGAWRAGNAGCFRGTRSAGGTRHGGDSGCRRCLGAAARALVGGWVHLCSALGAFDGACLNGWRSEAHGFRPFCGEPLIVPFTVCWTSMHNSNPAYATSADWGPRRFKSRGPSRYQKYKTDNLPGVIKELRTRCPVCFSIVATV